MTNPDKEKVREWLKNRHEPASSVRKPIPTPEEIRRELGWDLTDTPQRPQDEPNKP